VREKKSDDDLLRETVSRDVGSLESRAAAKMLIRQIPVVITEHMKKTSPHDGPPTGPPTCNSRTAKVRTADGTYKILTRNDGETDAQFRERCIAETPAMQWGFVTMHGDAEE
jgi:hypothetical protein